MSLFQVNHLPHLAIWDFVWDTGFCPGLVALWLSWWSTTTAKGSVTWSDAPLLDWPYSQVFAKLTSLGEAISYECLSNSPQLCGIVPETIEGTVEKFIVKHDVEFGGLRVLWLNSTQVPRCQRGTDYAPCILQFLSMVPIWVDRLLQNSVGEHLARRLGKLVYGTISLWYLPL